jgi:signal transduction histidine kinase
VPEALPAIADEGSVVPLRAHHRLLWHSLLLGEWLHLFGRLRFIAAAFVVVGAVFADWVVGIEGLPVTALGACAAFLVLSNLVTMRLIRPYRRPEQAAQGYGRLVMVAHSTILLDYLTLTCVIWLVGGGRSPFLAFYVLHAAVAAVLLSRRAAFAHSLVGYLLLVGLVVGEWLSAVPKYRPVGAVFGGSDGDLRVVLTVLFVYGLLTLATTFLMTRIARRLRDGELRLREASEDIEKLANLRRAFLHVVLHDLKSPVGTVVTLLDNLKSGLSGPLNEDQANWLNRAEVRLRGLLDLLRDLQILAELETGRIDKFMAALDVLSLVRTAVDDHADLARERGIGLRAELPERLPAVRGVERLLRQAVANYLTNALKYSPAGGSVVARASSLDLLVRIEVTDDGPGISPSDQRRLFQEFNRLAMRKGSEPEASGTGLGLSIVRRIAEAHGGRAGVQSDVGQGSTFFLEIPIDLPAHSGEPGPHTDIDASGNSQRAG